MAVQGELSDARVWLHILRGVLQTDGFRDPVGAADLLFARYKERFTGARGASIEDANGAGPLAEPGRASLIKESNAIREHKESNAIRERA